MKKLSFLLLTFASLISAKNATSQDAIVADKNAAIVETVSGKVKGYTHNGIFNYKGIPYAKAERFTAPVKVNPWTGVRSSMSYGPVCPTDVTTTVNDEFEFPFQHNWGYTNENCLTLNIWTKGINDQKKRPVMVWLHGGGFTAGSSIELPSYDGENLTKKGDVVVVSVNHRLNVLGFLDLSAYGEKYKSSANAGLLDLVAALQWVKQNIANFGGDPENVTIFGQSGGGGKVTCLMNAPSAKGLFQKAIVQSGSYLVNFTEAAVTKRISAALLEELQLQPSQVDSLQKISYERLNAAGKKAIAKVQQQIKAEGKPVEGFGLGWGPVLDGSFLPNQPGNPAAIELSKNIPLLVGSTKNEFAPFIPGSRDMNMDQAKEFIKKKYGDNADKYMAALNSAYPNTVKPSDFIDIDFMFRAGALRQANMKAIPGAAPVYMYLFTWQSPVNNGMYKAMHCMDLAFQFDNISRCQEMTGGGKEACELANKISQAWINFAKNGDPNNKELPNWPKYTAENGATMIFDNKCEIKNHHDQELIKIGTAK
ncbi:MAG: carboxylesterase/lipase family protein [Ferruginibacter sp.]